MVWITLLRHGRSQADDDNVYEGRYDSELTAVGKKQVSDLLEKWKHQASRSYDTILTSPLRRASATARVLADHYGVPLIENDLLMEIDSGKLAGMNKAEAERLLPPPAFTSPYDRIAHGSGESYAQLHARALMALEWILNMKRERYLVVAHGGILNAMLRTAMGIAVPINRSGTYFKLGDLGYAELAYDPAECRWTMLELHKPDWSE